MGAPVRGSPGTRDGFIRSCDCSDSSLRATYVDCNRSPREFDDRLRSSMRKGRAARDCEAYHAARSLRRYSTSLHSLQKHLLVVRKYQIPHLRKQRSEMFLVSFFLSHRPFVSLRRCRRRVYPPGRVPGLRELSRVQLSGADTSYTGLLLCAQYLLMVRKLSRCRGARVVVKKHLASASVRHSEELKQLSLTSLEHLSLRAVVRCLQLNGTGAVTISPARGGTHPRRALCPSRSTLCTAKKAHPLAKFL